MSSSSSDSKASIPPCSPTISKADYELSDLAADHDTKLPSKPTPFPIPFQVPPYPVDTEAFYPIAPAAPPPLPPPRSSGIFVPTPALILLAILLLAETALVAIYTTAALARGTVSVAPNFYVGGQTVTTTVVSTTATAVGQFTTSAIGTSTVSLSSTSSAAVGVLPSLTTETVAGSTGTSSAVTSIALVTDSD